MLMMVGFAGASDYTLHTLVTNTTDSATNITTMHIYTWLGDNIPVLCGNGATATCTLSIAENNTCNMTSLDPILQNLSIINANVNGLNASITSSTAPLLTTTQASAFFDKLKIDITGSLGTTTQDTLAPFLQNSADITDLKINITKDEGTINTLNSQLSSCETDLTNTTSSKNDITYGAIVLLILLIGFVLKVNGMLPGSGNKRIKSPSISPSYPQ